MTMLYVAAGLIGFIAGLRTMTALAAVSWATWLGKIDLTDTSLALLGFRFSPWIFSLVAALELFTDKLERTPSRKVPLQFTARLFVGALCGGIICNAADRMIQGIAAGMVGAILGTLIGASARAALARLFGADRPAALIEDVVAVGGAAVIVQMFL